MGDDLDTIKEYLISVNISNIHLEELTEKRGIFCSIIISLALLGIFPIQAAPNVFNETTDFGTTNSGTTFLGTFDIGVNTVSGSILALAGADRVTRKQTLKLNASAAEPIRIGLSGYSNRRYFARSNE